jgi:hypothetical protein
MENYTWIRSEDKRSGKEYGGITPNPRAHQIEYKSQTDFVDIKVSSFPICVAWSQVTDIVLLVVAVDDGLHRQKNQLILPQKKYR